MVEQYQAAKYNTTDGIHHVMKFPSVAANGRIGVKTEQQQQTWGMPC